MRSLRKHQWVRWAAVVIWMGVIFYLSAQSTLPDLTGGRFPELESIAGHFAVYFVLALLWHRVLAGAGLRQPALWAFVMAVLYGVSDELHQGFVPGRNPDVFDLATDAAGAAVAILARYYREIGVILSYRSRPGGMRPGNGSHCEGLQPRSNPIQEREIASGYRPRNDMS